MKLFNSANIDIINTCRWYRDFQLPSEVLVKRVPNSRGNLRTVKIYIVILEYRRKLVSLHSKYTSLTLLPTDVLCFSLFCICISLN